MASEEQVSKMENDDRASLLDRPITYHDILGARGELGVSKVTPEDSALMQSAEARTFGKTPKDGAAATMQAAAEENVKAGFVKRGEHSQVAEEGVAVQEILIPGAAIDVEYIAGQPVMESVTPLPTDSFIAVSEAVTIGEALEGAALAGDRPVTKSDARAIQSAVSRATGAAPTAGGLAATAMAAAELNNRVPSADKTTLSDILMDASADLDVDKIVTQEDAAKVREAELRGSSEGELPEGSVAAALQVAADINELMGPTDGHLRLVTPPEDFTPAPELEHAPQTTDQKTPGAAAEPVHAKVE